MVGVWRWSIEDAGFSIGYEDHIMYSIAPYVVNLYAILIGVN